MGWSNETIIEDNEACFNGSHRPPQGPVSFQVRARRPQAAPAGIILAGICNHTICRGNKCIGNNGAGICLFGDDHPKPAFAAFHWVLENNVVSDNRWGVYMEFADWINMAGNILANNRDGDIIKGGTNTNITAFPTIP